MAQSDVHVSPTQLAHYLRGLDFPANKQDLKADAQRNQAPAEILKVIDELPAPPVPEHGRCHESSWRNRIAETATKCPRSA
jgi:hypothetical protein